MLVMSGLLDELEEYSYAPNGDALCIYNNPAYPLRQHLQCPFRERQALTPEQQAFKSFHEQGSCFRGVGVWRNCLIFQVL